MSTPMSEERIDAAWKHSHELDQLYRDQPEYCSHDREDGALLRDLVAEVRRLRDITLTERAKALIDAVSQERNDLASKLATAVEALRWYESAWNKSTPEWQGQPQVLCCKDMGSRARIALAAVERKETQT